MKHRPRTLTCLALYCAAGLALTSCSFIGADQLRHTRSPESLSTDPALETTGQAILEDALDALLEANEVKVRAKGSTDGVPFSYVVAGDYDFEYAQSFEMRDGKGHVQWLADGPTSTYFVKANNSHGDLIEPTDHEDFLNALREDRWLRLPESEVASMILVSDEIDELFDFLESSIDHEDMKYQGVLDLDGVPAHRFSSPESTLWLSADDSPLPLRLETVHYEPYTRMTSTYRDWNEEIYHELPVEGEYAAVPELTTRKA